jgi:hypothetical protein
LGVKLDDFGNQPCRFWESTLSILTPSFVDFGSQTRHDSEQNKAIFDGEKNYLPSHRLNEPVGGSVC